jgi:hypothetical protein
VLPEEKSQSFALVVPHSTSLLTLVLFQEAGIRLAVSTGESRQVRGFLLMLRRFALTYADDSSDGQPLRLCLTA